MDTNETKVYTVVLMAACVLGIIVIYFVISIIRFQRKNLLLQKQKLLAEITTLEDERKRIAGDLHDELGPLLSAVKLHINSVDADDEGQELIRKASIHIDTILARIREIANDLMPQTLLRKGLVIAVREFVDNLKPVHPIQIDFFCGENIVVAADLEVHLYRIIMEIIQNTIKHAQASALKIEYRRENNKLVLLINDNGDGFEFDPADNKKQPGLGLKNILSRVQIVKGEVFVDTAPGKGTMYNIEIPV